MNLLIIGILLGFCAGVFVAMDKRPDVAAQWRERDKIKDQMIAEGRRDISGVELNRMAGLPDDAERPLA